MCVQGYLMCMDVSGAFTLFAGASEAQFLLLQDHLRWARDAGEISAYPGISQLYLRCNMHWGMGWVWAECVQGYLMPVDV